MKNKIFAFLETVLIYITLGAAIYQAAPIFLPGYEIQMDWYNFRWVFLGFAFTFSLVLNYNARVKPKKVETLFIDNTYGYITSKNRFVDINPCDYIHLKGHKYRVDTIDTEGFRSDTTNSLVVKIFVDEVFY